MSKRKLILWMSIWIQLATIASCRRPPNLAPLSSATANSPVIATRIDRELQIPAQATKVTPETDVNPPLVYASDYEQPIPVPGRVNTAGAEDSPFVSPDGKTLYFFFTPDANVPVQQQVLDGVTGIYMSHYENGEWARPERVILQDPGKLAGDGCEFVQGNVMWFCSVREGYTGLHWFTAEFQNGILQNWQIADFNPEFQVGEFHISTDGTELYFASERPGGKGELDIWVSKLANDVWQEPANVTAVNTIHSEGWPALNPAADELWFTRDYGIWRSKRVNGEWQEAELIVSPLAGEPSIDSAGNLYFVHHFYVDDTLIEADIYVAYKR